MPANASAAWPDDLLATTKALYEGGEHSAAQIAVKIGHGKSRNAVIGMASRKGWTNPHPKKGGTEKGDKKQREKKQREKKPRTRQLRVGGPNWMRPVMVPAIELPAEVPKPENFLGLTIQELADDQCRFPDGDGPYFFCGNPTQGDSSYCRFHYRLCHERRT